MKPSERHIKEFWEWCGFKYRDYLSSFGNIPETKEAWLYPDGSMCFLSSFGTATGLPNLDLNNIVKYAVPKLIKKGLGCTVSQDNLGANACTYVPFAPEADGVYSEGKGEDPALALFWAIWEVIKQ